MKLYLHTINEVSKALESYSTNGTDTHRERDATESILLVPVTLISLKCLPIRLLFMPNRLLFLEKN